MRFQHRQSIIKTNIITLITKNGTEKLPKLSKFECANAILDRIIKGENA